MRTSRLAGCGHPTPRMRGYRPDYCDPCGGPARAKRERWLGRRAGCLSPAREAVSPPDEAPTPVAAPMPDTEPSALAPPTPATARPEYPRTFRPPDSWGRRCRPAFVGRR